MFIKHVMEFFFFTVVFASLMWGIGCLVFHLYKKKRKKKVIYLKNKIILSTHCVSIRTYRTCNGFMYCG